MSPRTLLLPRDLRLPTRPSLNPLRLVSVPAQLFVMLC
jgi:hypothetical protein